MTRLVVVMTLLSACAGTRARPAAPCTPPLGAASEVRDTIGAADCVAFVDEDVSPVSARPAIWRRHDGRWSKITVDGVENDGWVATASSGDTIVAALDSRVESPGWEVTVVRSRDGGVSWSPPITVRKPYYLATVEKLVVAANGAATVTVVLGDGYGSGVRPGRYQLPVGP